MPDPQDAVAPEVIKVPIIQGTGDGRLPADMQGTLLPTPGGANANVVTIIVHPLVALLVRAGFMFFSVFSATIGTGGVTGNSIIPWTSFEELLWKSAALAGVATFVDLAKNLVTIFKRLESKYPLLTGSV